MIRIVPLVAVLLTGCLAPGPLPLQQVLRPDDEKEYTRHLIAQPSPKHAYLAWKSSRENRDIKSLAEEDARLGADHNPFAATAPHVSRGALIYKVHCTSCHGMQADGRGPTMDRLLEEMDFHAWPKRFAMTYFNNTPGKWFRSIHKGKASQYLGSDGKPYTMPTFADTLTREQIWLAITYLMSGTISNLEISLDERTKN